MAHTNIVMILVDDMGYGDSSCYGQKSWTTPNLDRMAAEGIRFTDFYSTSPVCSPARTSLMTGLHSGRLPIRRLDDEFLPDDTVTIPKRLREQGYVCACIGKYGLGFHQPEVDPLRKGFDYHYGYQCMRHAHNYYPPFLRENGLRANLRNKPPAGDTEQMEYGWGVAEEKIDYSADLIEERALEFIHDCKDRPFFLYFCPTLPHANNEGGDTPDGMEVDTYGEFDNRDWAPNEKGFARMIQKLDISVGKVMDTLKELGIAENTLVLFASDNGPHQEGGHSVTCFDSAGGFQGYKRSLHEGGIRVPFIAWWPGTVQSAESDYQGFFPDIMPTICEVAGTTTGCDTDGLSLVPLLKGDAQKQPAHEYLYFEYRQQLAVRKGDWKYYVNKDADEVSLFNLAEDRHEDNDVKGDNADILAELEACVAREHRDYTPQSSPVFYEPQRNKG